MPLRYRCRMLRHPPEDWSVVQTEKVKVASIVAPTSSDAAYKPSFKINFDGQTFDIDAEGNMAKADLVNYIVEKFGKRPSERDIDATLDAWVNNGSTAIKMASMSRSEGRLPNFSTT